MEEKSTIKPNQEKLLPDELLEKLPEDLNARLRGYYCSSCGRFLAFYAIVEGTIVIKCRRCKEYNVLDVREQLK